MVYFVAQSLIEFECQITYQIKIYFDAQGMLMGCHLFLDKFCIATQVHYDSLYCNESVHRLETAMLVITQHFREGE